MAGQNTILRVSVIILKPVQNFLILIENTLVRLGYNNSVRPDFVEATMYDTACPAKNDPVPGRGAF